MNNLSNMDSTELRKILEANLPDYVFGNLSGEELAFFNQNYESFPDLVKEVKDAKALFSRVDRMNFERIFDEQTRNTTVKVNNRLENRSSSIFGKNWGLRVAMPAFGLVAILVMVWTGFFDGDKMITINQSSIAKFNKPLIDSAEYTKLIEDLSAHDEAVGAIIPSMPLVEVSQDAIDLESEDEIALLDEYDKTIEAAYEDSPELFWGYGSQSNESIINELNTMTEDEFQALLEELSLNEKIRD